MTASNRGFEMSNTTIRIYCGIVIAFSLGYIIGSVL
jgi:hypothetical protein